MTDADAIVNFNADNNSALFKFKQKITGVTGERGTKSVKIMVPLKYLSNFWRILEIPLIKCEINLILTWSDKCVLSNGTKATTFAITDTKLYVPVVTLFEKKDDRTVHTKYYLPTLQIKDYNDMIDGQNFFDQPVKKNLITYDNIRKIVIGQGDDYTTGCLLDNNYFNNYYKMIAINLSKQQAQIQ